jgi:hypothetical protein
MLDIDVELLWAKDRADHVRFMCTYWATGKKKRKEEFGFGFGLLPSPPPSVSQYRIALVSAHAQRKTITSRVCLLEFGFS